MRRLAKRDVRAFETLFDAYHRLVFGIALRVLGDAASAEDLTQSVFLKIWANPERFREGSFSSWISRVARNASLDVLRRRTHHITEVPVDVPLHAGLEDAVIASLDAQRVRSALLRLPAVQRIAIEMGFFGGMTYDGVANTIGVPVGTVKTRIRAGLSRLREALADSEHAR